MLLSYQGFIGLDVSSLEAMREYLAALSSNVTVRTLALLCPLLVVKLARERNSASIEVPISIWLCNYKNLFWPISTICRTF